MASIDLEERLYDEEVVAVKQWWDDSRWRYTRRPFTAEQIVAKRGNLKIDYPSNTQSKKLWKILESRFKVGGSSSLNTLSLNPSTDQRREFYLRCLGANYADANGQIFGHCLCIRLAMLFHRFIHR